MTIKKNPTCLVATELRLLVLKDHICSTLFLSLDNPKVQQACIQGFTQVHPGPALKSNLTQQYSRGHASVPAGTMQQHKGLGWGCGRFQVQVPHWGPKKGKVPIKKISQQMSRGTNKQFIYSLPNMVTWQLRSKFTVTPLRFPGSAQARFS